MRITSVEDLDVNRDCLALLDKVNELANKIPFSHRRLRDQFIGSTHGIPPLLSEGYARRVSLKETKRFFRMAMAECDETVTHLRAIWILKVDQDLCKELGLAYKLQAKKLNNLTFNWGRKK